MPQEQVEIELHYTELLVPTSGSVRVCVSNSGWAALPRHRKTRRQNLKMDLSTRRIYIR